jgi:hypothetical protein
MVKLYNWSPNGLESWIISYTMAVIASGSQLASYNFSSYSVKSGATDPYIWGKQRRLPAGDPSPLPLISCDLGHGGGGQTRSVAAEMGC